MIEINDRDQDRDQGSGLNIRIKDRDKGSGSRNNQESESRIADLQLLLQLKPHLVFVADIIHRRSNRSPGLIEGHPGQLEMEVVNEY